MFEDDRITTLDEQGRKLSAAFAEADQKNAQRRRGRPALRIGLAVGALAAVALIVGAVYSGRGGGELTLDQAVAEVSRIAIDQPGSQPGKYAYLHDSRTMIAPEPKGGKPAYFTQEDESWYRDGDPTYWTRIGSSSTSWAKASAMTCEMKVRKGYSPLDVGTGLELLNRGGFPKTSEAVYGKLHAEGSDDSDGLYSRDAQIWDEIGMGMGAGVGKLTPEQRSLLVGALAYIPGVTTMGKVVDPNGTEAIGFERNADGHRSRIFFDAKTSMTTYTDSYYTEPEKTYDAPAGALRDRYNLLDFRYVDTLPDLKQTPPHKTEIAPGVYNNDTCPD